MDKTKLEKKFEEEFNRKAKGCSCGTEEEAYKHHKDLCKHPKVT